MFKSIITTKIQEALRTTDAWNKHTYIISKHQLVHIHNRVSHSKSHLDRASNRSESTRQSYMTQRPSLFSLISYCAIVFSCALMFANGWFTACDGFYDAY